MTRCGGLCLFFLVSTRRRYKGQVWKCSWLYFLGSSSGLCLCVTSRTCGVNLAEAATRSIFNGLSPRSRVYWLVCRLCMVEASRPRGCRGGCAWFFDKRKFRYSVAVGGPGMQPWLGRRSKASPAALCVWFPCECPAACPGEFSALARIERRWRSPFLLVVALYLGVVVISCSATFESLLLAPCLDCNPVG